MFEAWVVLVVLLLMTAVGNRWGALKEDRSRWQTTILF